MANPNTFGVAYNSIMIVPCMVTSWLYCSGDTTCRPGAASSVRIISAITPPAMKNANDVTRYITPICLWSVVRKIRSSTAPFGLQRGRQGRVGTSLGATDTIILQKCSTLYDHVIGVPQARVWRLFDRVWSFEDNSCRGEVS